MTDGVIKRLSDLQNHVNKAVEGINNVKAISKEQLDSTAGTRNRYESIKCATMDAEEATDKLIKSEAEIISCKNEILDMLQDLSAIAEENAAGTEQASSAMAEQNYSMEEIFKSSERLAQLSENLQDIIKNSSYDSIPMLFHHSRQRASLSLSRSLKLLA